MQITFSTVLLFVLSFALSEAVDSSLGAFLRDLPPSNFNFSHLLPEPENLEDVPNPPQAWFDDKPPAPANEYLWCKAVDKGTTLLDAMSYSDADAGQTFVPPRHSAQSLWSLGKQYT